MLFSSFAYFAFLAIVVIVFYLLPAVDRKIWLLISSYFFYACWNPAYLIILVFCTLSSYICAILLEKKEKYKKCIIAVCIIINIGILIFFKYSNFLITNVNNIFDFMAINKQVNLLDIVLPVGISFYIFQAIGYLIDVYRGKIKVEYNIIQYALFISFFPQISSGPIERANNMLPQYENIKFHRIGYSGFVERFEKSISLIMWGFFQKLVIADRIAIIVDSVFDNYMSYSSLDIIFATVLYGVQIYCDFDGYTNIARGSAVLFGIELMPNFRQPYLALNIKEFWARWHRSLTTWFTDYLYITLGGNRKGKIRKYINIFIVFAVSGLWHGASWHFMIWGAMHGVYLVIYNILNTKKKQEQQKKVKFCSRLLRIMATFALVDFAWFFFRVPNFSAAKNMIYYTFSSLDLRFSFPNEIFNHGNMVILMFSILILVIVDIFHEKNVYILQKVFCQQFWFYILVIVIIIFYILIFGVYGGGYDVSNFIYSKF